MAIGDDEAVRRVEQARVREAIMDAVPEDAEARRRFIDWLLPQLYAAAPDKAVWLVQMEDAIDRAMALEARGRGLQ